MGHPASSYMLDGKEWFADDQTMESLPNIAPIAALIGDPARARMLLTLLPGKALTMSELGQAAGIGKATVSSHLAQLSVGGLVAITPNGRHRYVTLASPQVARLIEDLMSVVQGNRPLALATGPKDQALRHARSCYHHLAGELGVQAYSSLRQREYLALTADGIAPTPQGLAFLRELGVDSASLALHPAPACRECLDWSERRHHLGGRLGRGILSAMIAADWLRPASSGRALHLSPKGARLFPVAFPVAMSAPFA
jgi:DNA-binding transcriptional ArsR family regulator